MSNERKRRQLVTLVALLVAGGVLAFLAFGGIGESLVYYWSPTELHAAGDEALGANIRLGGLVAAGSIRHGEGSRLEFVVTDGSEEIAVHATAVPPAMFREGIGVVVEGTLAADGTFQTQRLMIKHDNEYQAPEEDDERSVEELMDTMQFGATGG
jgi:cytochrome c-type biogenesis protein CcmE